MRAGIAFGSNLGDRLANLSAARQQIVGLAGVESPLLASSVFETEPIDCEPGAPSFLNAAMEIGYRGAASELLPELRRIEAQLGRPAAHDRNTSRTLDLDLLYFGDLASSEPALELPHPRLAQRRFVLEPLAEIRPELVLPGQCEPVRVLLGKLAGTQPLVRVASRW
jgi:2-amino-4-hydroxy-6-hydroxymethyldihydropteridine diphosphokinase